MTRRLGLVLIAAAACGHKDDAPPPPTSSPAPVSVLEPGAPPPAPTTYPGVRRDLTALVGKATHVAIGDVDGDGKPDLVVADASTLRVLVVSAPPFGGADGGASPAVEAADHELASAPVNDGIQQLVVADLDGDHHAEIVAGWGLTREHKDGVAKVTIDRLDGGKLVEEVVMSPTTTRQDVAAIVPIPGTPPQLLIAYFESKYDVAAVTATGGKSWTLAPLATIRMATSWARGDVDGDGKPDIVVGRLYGDTKEAAGDAFVLRDGARIPIPTTRGVHGLAIAELDGKPQIFLGDGWHQNYGAYAKGLVTSARWSDGAFQAALVEDTTGQYAINRILVADLDGDGQPEIVTQGNAYVRVFKRVGDTWKGLTVAGIVRDIAVGNLDGVPGDELVTVGDKSEVISLHDVRW